MKNPAHHIKIFGLFGLSVFWSFGFVYQATTAAQGENRRARAFAGTTATPKPTLSPQTPATPKPSVKPSASPTPSATPTVMPSATATPIQNIADLHAKIRQTLARPELRRGSVGVKIVALDQNRTIFEENAEKYFMPASNMKSYTVAAALEKLSPDFRFVTSVYAAGAPDATGTIRGDLTVFGRGDVSFSQAFDGATPMRGINALTDQIALAGVKRIEGDLVGDESFFQGETIPASWEWDDLQWKSGAEISALPVNDNLVELNVKPGASGAPCAVQTLPANAIFRIVNQCRTVAAGERDLRVTKKLDQNILEINGALPVGDRGFQGNVTVSRPARLFVELLRAALAQKGVTVAGQNRVVNRQEKALMPGGAVGAPVEIARVESPPFSVVAAKTMKPSQNTYTEIVLWTLGEEVGRKQAATAATDEISIKKLQKATSHELGVQTVKNFLTEIGVPPDGVIQWDGSGLSRHNLITPASAVQLYTYMSKSRYANAWRDSLTVGAVDGTLQRRFAGTVAANNARGKTGTIDQVSTLSGYVTTAAGEPLVFSILVNGVNDVRLRQAAIDEIVVALAAFNGKL